MSDKEKDETLNDDQVNIETNNINLNNNEKKESGSEPQAGNIKFLMSELNEQLEKEKKNSTTATDKWKRALADYQNLEKQTIDRINAREDKIILHFLTVYEDFIRAKNAYEKDGTNVEGLDVIIKNMWSILDNYEVKAIESEGKFDPKLHEVVQEIEEDSLEEGTIVKEIAKGYIIRGEVLKYSKVCVSKKLIKK